MAKKSAASKGYRKVKKAKPFLTKKEIIALAVIVVAIIIGVIVINQLPKLGTIPASKVQEGDIISIANTEARNRYVKVGTIGSLEGYTLEASTSTENPTGGYRFIPEDESSNIEYMRVGGAIWDAERMIANSASYLQGGGVGTDDHTLEPIETTINGSRAFISSARTIRTDEEIAASEEELEKYTQFIYAYVDSIDGHSVSMNFTLSGDDSSVHIPDEGLEEFVTQFAGAFTLPEDK